MYASVGGGFGIGPLTHPAATSTNAASATTSAPRRPSLDNALIADLLSARRATNVANLRRGVVGVPRCAPDGVLNVNDVGFDPGYGALVDTTGRIAAWNVWARYGPWERRAPAIAAVLRGVDADIV